MELARERGAGYREMQLVGALGSVCSCGNRVCGERPKGSGMPQEPARDEPDRPEVEAASADAELLERREGTARRAVWPAWVLAAIASVLAWVVIALVVVLFFT